MAKIQGIWKLRSVLETTCSINNTVVESFSPTVNSIKDYYGYTGSTSSNTGIYIECNETNIVVRFDRAVADYVTIIECSNIVGASTNLYDPENYSTINFGTSPREVSDDFWKMWNVVAYELDVKLSGYYTVNWEGIRNISVSYLSLPTIESINYVDAEGNSYTGLGYSGSAGYGSFYLLSSKGSALSVSFGGAPAEKLRLINFGDTPQRLNGLFYRDVFSKVCSPVEKNTYVDAVTLPYIVNNIQNVIENNLTSAVKNSAPKVVELKAYRARTSCTADDRSFTVNKDYQNDMLIMIVTDHVSGTVHYLNISTQNIPLNSSIYIDCAGSAYTTRWKLEKTSTGAINISAFHAYGENGNQQDSSMGYILGVYAMKIGG